MKTIIEGYPVEWDEQKNEINKKKHGISFETAALVFADEDRIEYFDKLHTIRNGQKPTELQVREIEEASKRQILYDEDSPELTTEQYAEMAAVARQKREELKKPVVSLRISPVTLEKAQATGKGYTGFLSRLLDNAINDPNMVAKSL